MRWIRFVHSKFYDHDKKRFMSLAFNPSSNGGLSVVNEKCAVNTSGTVCANAKEYYPDRIIGDPPIYWIFDDSIFPCDIDIKPDRSNGDPRHHNIFGLTQKQAGKTFKQHTKVTCFFHDLLQKSEQSANSRRSALSTPRLGGFFLCA